MTGPFQNRWCALKNEDRDNAFVAEKYRQNLHKPVQNTAIKLALGFRFGYKSSVDSLNKIVISID